MNNTETRIYKIYAHVNKINQKMYIGQTCKKYIHSRWRYGEGYTHSPHFYNAIKKYGWDNFEHIILIDNIDDYRLADIIETELIRKFKTTDNHYGYNLSSGGSRGRVLSEETKNKMRLSKIGNKNPNYKKSPSQTTRKRMSESRIGMKQSEDWINKRKCVGTNNGMYGKKHSKEAIDKIREKTKGGNNASAKRCFLFSNQDDLTEFECLTYAYNTINMGTSYCRHHRLSGIYEDNTNRIIYILTEQEYSDFRKWLKDNDKEIDWFDIQKRYDLYNEWFYETHK